VSLRLKLALVIATIAGLVAGSTGVVVYAQEQSASYDQARKNVAQQLREVAALEEKTAIVAANAIFEPRNTARPEIPASLRARLTDSHVYTIFARSNGVANVIAGTRLRSGDRIYLARDFSADARSLANLRVLLVQVCVSAAAIGALLGLVVSILLGRPIRRSAALARQLAAGDLHARLRPSGNDEIAQLGRALDEMAEALGTKLQELDDAAEREKRFSGDVAHELRTPVAGLVAAAALLDDSKPARMVRERAAALAALVEDLLEVMRLESARETARVDEFDLTRLVRDVVRNRLPDADVSLPETLRISSDPRRIERVLANLLDNARRHGEPPVDVCVSTDDHDAVVVVRDSGHGFGGFLPHAGERFALAARERGGGTGLGLAIARGQARLLGGALELHDEHGAVATLRLPGVIADPDSNGSRASLW
jgi:signal transduction histidine kinase